MWLDSILLILFIVQWTECSERAVTEAEDEDLPTVDPNSDYPNDKQPVPENAAELVSYLRQLGIIRTERVAEVMSMVNRPRFLPQDYPHPWENYPVFLEFNLIDAPPNMTAFALEILKDHLKPGNKVLDVGYGSGYLTACFAMMVGETGKVTAIDNIPEQVFYGMFGVDDGVTKPMFKKNRIRFVAVGDLIYGDPDDAPYDAIYVTPATMSVPKQFFLQLKKGGRLVIPIGMMGHMKEIQIYDKDMDGNFQKSKVLGYFAINRNFDGDIDPPFFDQLNYGGRLVVPIGKMGPLNNITIYDKDMNGNLKKHLVKGKFHMHRNFLCEIKPPPEWEIDTEPPSTTPDWFLGR